MTVREQAQQKTRSVLSLFISYFFLSFFSTKCVCRALRRPTFPPPPRTPTTTTSSITTRATLWAGGPPRGPSASPTQQQQTGESILGETKNRSESASRNTLKFGRIKSRVWFHRFLLQLCMCVLWVLSLRVCGFFECAQFLRTLRDPLKLTLPHIVLATYRSQTLSHGTICVRVTKRCFFRA